MKARVFWGFSIAATAFGCASTKGADGAASRPVFVDDDSAFHASPAFRRTGDEPDQSSNRHYMKSMRADYIASDWTFRLSFHAAAHAPDDIIFVGLGEAVPDPTFFNEPRNSVYFRIHQGVTAFEAGWRVDVAAHDRGHFHWTYYNEAVGRLPGPEGGTHMLQIRKTGAQLTFEIIDAGIIVTVPDLGKAAPFLYSGPSRIFFGNASGAYRFENPESLPVVETARRR